MITLEINE